MLCGFADKLQEEDCIADPCDSGVRQCLLLQILFLSQDREIVTEGQEWREKNMDAVARAEALTVCYHVQTCLPSRKKKKSKSVKPRGLNFSLCVVISVNADYNVTFYRKNKNCA